MNMHIFQVIGCAIIVAGLVGVSLLLVNKVVGNKVGILLFVAFVASGLLLIVQHGIFHDKIGDLADVQAEAETDARRIKDILTEVQEYREQVRAHSHAINFAAKEATQVSRQVEQVNMQRAEITEFMKRLSVAVEQAQHSEDKLEAANAFAMTVIRAQNDDREAFDELGRLSKDGTNELSMLAARAYGTIVDAHSQPFYLSGFNIPWGEGIDPSKLSLDELIVQYGMAAAWLRPGLIEFIWKRNDLPKKPRLQFLIDVIRSDRSLRAVEYAGHYFMKGTQLKIKPLAVDQLLDWWEKNKDTISNQ